MANTTISPNMTLPVPVVGTDPGPQWATDVNACLSIIDSHDHSAGSGVQIKPAGININSDLTFGGNSATFLKAIKFTSQSSPLPGGSNLNAIYASGGNLYYNDGSGNQIQITASGAVAGTPGSISGLVSPASASYNSGTGTFVFQSAASTPGNLDGASLTIREKALSTNGITFASPTALAANYTLTWPGALPASIKFLTVDNSGNVGDSSYIDNSTIESASNVIQLKDNGTTNIKLNYAAPTIFTSNGTFSVPSNCSRVRIIGCGGGGGGGGFQNGGTGGGGGAGAPVFEGLVDVTPGDTLTITIGGGGAGGANGPSGAAGTAGTSTTITGTGVNMTFSGGSGGGNGAGGGLGGAGQYGSHNGSNGAPNSAGVSYLTVMGGLGTGGTASGATAGAGGGSYGAGALNSNPNGVSAAANTGGGGGGNDRTASNGSGGTGGSGIVKIYLTN